MLTTEQVAGLTRAILAAGGGYLANKGLVDAELFTTLSGVVVAVITAAWSIYAKRKPAV
jgi:hypothetical protein